MTTRKFIKFKTKAKQSWSGMLLLSVAVLSITLCAQTALAREQPRALATDQRIKVVAFQADNVVPIQASTFTTTQVVFGKGEMIQNIQNGDLDAWTVSVQKDIPNMLFLKPTILGSNTNMTVVTSAHTYYFHLKSNTNLSNAQDNSTYAVHFIYPQQARKKMLATLRYNQQQKRAIVNAHKNPQDYNWQYSFSGAKSIVPLHIFDDGRFTYFQLREGQPLPAVFSVDNTLGKESVVNYRRTGNYLVIQQVAPQFSLREGKTSVASIFNNKRIHQLRAHGEG